MSRVAWKGALSLETMRGPWRSSETPAQCSWVQKQARCRSRWAGQHPLCVGCVDAPATWPFSISCTSSPTKLPLHVSPLSTSHPLHFYPPTPHPAGLSLFANALLASQNRPNSAVRAPCTYSYFLEFIRVFSFLFFSFFLKNQKQVFYLFISCTEVHFNDTLGLRLLAIAVNYHNHTTATNPLTGFPSVGFTGAYPFLWFLLVTNFN